MSIENVGPGGVGNSYGVRGTTNPQLLSSNRTITALDEGKVFECTTALTITIPVGLSPRPDFIVIPPSSGNVTISAGVGATVNGSGTRSLASNPAGVAVVAYINTDAYGVSGS